MPTDGKNVMYYLHGGWIKLPQKRCKNWVLIKENASLSEKLAAFFGDFKRFKFQTVFG